MQSENPVEVTSRRSALGTWYIPVHSGSSEVRWLVCVSRLHHILSSSWNKKILRITPWVVTGTNEDTCLRFLAGVGHRGRVKSMLAIGITLLERSASNTGVTFNIEQSRDQQSA